MCLHKFYLMEYTSHYGRNRHKVEEIQMKWYGEGTLEETQIHAYMYVNCVNKLTNNKLIDAYQNKICHYIPWPMVSYNWHKPTRMVSWIRANGICLDIFKCHIYWAVDHGIYKLSCIYPSVWIRDLIVMLLMKYMTIFISEDLLTTKMNWENGSI